MFARHANFPECDSFALLPVIPGEAGLHSWFNVHKSVECHDRTRDDRRT